MSTFIDNKIYLFRQHQGHQYMSVLGFDDRQFCSQIFTLLNVNLGRPIKEIGDLYVGHLL
jgi:hypothetical protein